MKQNKQIEVVVYVQTKLLTSEECDELVEKIKSTEKGEQGCLDIATILETTIIQILEM